MEFNLHTIINWWPSILSALVTTTMYFIICSIGAILFAIIVSVLFALRNSIITPILKIYISVFRNTPLLVQLFILFYVLPSIGIFMSSFLCALIGVTLNEGAFISEIIRGYIDTVPREDWEAAQSLGLSQYQVIRYAILPQALRNAVPAITGQTSIVIKDTSLFSMIMIYELTRVSNSIYARTFDTSGFFLSALFYLMLFIILSIVSKQIESKFKVRR